MVYDLFVIGGGSGGVRAARLAGAKGMKVGLAEGNRLGGTCVNRGCIPKKLYSYSAHFLEEIQIMKSFGWSVNGVKFSWSKLVKNKKIELERLNKIYEGLLKKSGVEIFKFWAKFIDNKTIKLSNNSIIKAKKILIAVGGEPIIPKITGSKYFLTSDEIFDVKKLPKSIMILGGGYIAIEFASIFNGLGVDTTLCLRGDKVLRGFDTEVVDFLVNEMKKKGVKFIINSSPRKIEKKNNKLIVEFDTKKKKFDVILAAIGRKTNIDKLAIHNTNVKLNSNKSIIVNKFYQTFNNNIFSIGDVIDKIQLTPVAINEAAILINNFYSKRKVSLNYNYVPTAVFGNPNFATVGFTEKEAKLRFKKIDVYLSDFKPLKLSMSKSSERVLIKLIVERKTQKVLGLHYVGMDAAEIVQGFSVAILAGLKKSDFDKTIGIHPSSAEEIVTLN